MAARPVHYVANGGTYAFACFWKEQRAWIDEWKRIGNATQLHQARRHSRLDKVTCPECWDAIRDLCAVSS